MSIKKLVPQSKDRVDWEIEVANTLCDLIDCDYGDATGIMDVHADLIDGLYAAGTKPEEAAAKVSKASEV